MKPFPTHLPNISPIAANSESSASRHNYSSPLLKPVTLLKPFFGFQEKVEQTTRRDPTKIIATKFKPHLIWAVTPLE